MGADAYFDNPNRLSLNKRRRGELLWELRKDGVIWSAELSALGGGSGWEVRILREGTLFASERFVLMSSAAAWADAKCADVARGWTVERRRQPSRDERWHYR